jgi:hypothetical protein
MSDEAPNRRAENALFKWGIMASAAVGIFLAGASFDRWYLGTSYTLALRPNAAPGAAVTTATIDAGLALAGLTALFVTTISAVMLLMRRLGQKRDPRNDPDARHRDRGGRILNKGRLATHPANDDVAGNKKNHCRDG